MVLRCYPCLCSGITSDRYSKLWVNRKSVSQLFDLSFPSHLVSFLRFFCYLDLLPLSSATMIPHLCSFHLWPPWNKSGQLTAWPYGPSLTNTGSLFSKVMLSRVGHTKKIQEAVVTSVVIRATYFNQCTSKRLISMGILR